MTTTNTPARQALSSRPMDDKPIRYPLVPLASLSDDARSIHQHRAGGARLDRDIFDGKRRSFVSREEGDAFTPTARMLTAIAELEAAGLASYSPAHKSLTITRVHEQYTFARGRGSQFIRVSTFEEDPHEAELRAVLIGGDLESRDPRSGMTELTVRTRHEDATDFEHGASSTAMLVLRNISEPVFTGYGRMTFTGVLTEARLYPIGIDPLEADDGDTSAGEMCTGCETPHPFAPYLPPKVESLQGAHFVTVETLPFRPYLVQDPAAVETASGA